MNDLLMYHLIRDIVDERHATAARERQASFSRTNGPFRWRWLGPRLISRRNRQANSTPVIATASSTGSAQ